MLDFYIVTIISLATAFSGMGVGAMYALLYGTNSVKHRGRMMIIGFASALTMLFGLQYVAMHGYKLFA